MKNKLILIYLLLTVSFGVSAQNSNHKVANSITRNMLVYQTLNDFTTTVPVFFMVPGWFVFGSIEVSHVPVFVNEAYYNNVDVNNRKNAMHKELFDAIHVDFFPDIPSDKQMEVRVLENSRLLYRLRFVNQGDTLELVQVSGINSDEKRFLIYQGDLIGVYQKDKHGLSIQQTQIFGDSLRVQTSFDAKKSRSSKSEIRYQGSSLHAEPKSISYFKSNNKGAFRLVSTETYRYLEGRLATVETTNRRGNQTEITFFRHSIDGKLILLRKQKAGKLLLSIENHYDDHGLLEKKNVTTSRRNFDIYYHYKGQKIERVTIKNLYRGYSNEFVFDINLENKLSRIEHNKTYDGSQRGIDSESILFGYHQNGNIETIRLLDHKGRISKDIQFEYDYFGL